MKKTIFMVASISPLGLIDRVLQSDDKTPLPLNHTQHSLPLESKPYSPSDTTLRISSVHKESMERARKNACITILNALYHDPVVGPALGLTGGKAVEFFYEVARPTEDLDFALVKEEGNDLILKRLTEILSRFGTLKKILNLPYALSYVLSYKGEFSIKIDVIKKNYGSQYEVKQFMGIPIRVMVLQDMAAHKMSTLLRRIRNTTLYDVWYLLASKWPINKELIQRKTGLTYKKFLATLIARLSRQNLDETILSKLNGTLLETQKVSAKRSLIHHILYLLNHAYSVEP